jgi:hypothetical protein
MSNRSLLSLETPKLVWLRTDACPTLQWRPHLVSGRLQPLQFCLELEAQLSAFIFGKPVRHLWENSLIERARAGRVAPFAISLAPDR